MLHQEHGFDRSFPVSTQEIVDPTAIELRRNDLGNFVVPPIGGFAAVMETDPAELPRIAKDEGALLLKQNQMIVFSRAMARRFDPQRAGHAEMNA